MDEMEERKGICPKRDTFEADSGGDCAQCELLKQAQEKVNQMSKENDTLLTIMELVFSSTRLWVMEKGLLPGITEENVDQKFSDGKKEVSALFDKLIKTGEPSFVHGIFRALNLPEDFQHFV